MQRLSYIAHFQIARCKSTNPGQISSKAISGRDTGSKSGTVPAISGQLAPMYIGTMFLPHLL